MSIWHVKLALEINLGKAKGSPTIKKSNHRGERLADRNEIVSKLSDVADLLDLCQMETTSISQTNLLLKIMDAEIQQLIEAQSY
tara:strand:+ start:1244 stop:1495 length:252 start_codon:yes stop_codon:yes gene_type:complete